MNISELVHQLQQAEVVFWQEDGKIRTKVPKNLDAGLRQAMTEQREALRSHLTHLFKAGGELPRIGKAAADAIPLSFAQQRLWLIDQLQGSSAEYNMPMLYQVHGTFDLSLAAAALSQIIARHDILRTSYRRGSTGPEQYVRPAQPFQIQLSDLSMLPAEQQSVALEQLIAVEQHKPFDLTSDLMLRAHYIQQHRDNSSCAGWLLFNMHHIASDGWSMALLTEEFLTLYSGLSADPTFQLPPLELQYQDYAHWQRQWLSGARLDEELAYWQQQLAEVPVLHQLPTAERPAEKQYAGVLSQQNVSSVLVERLHQLARSQQLTPFMLLHGALALVLAQFSGSRDIVTGTPVANRQQPELTPLVGYFANTLVLRLNTRQPTLAAYLAHVRTVHLAAQARQELPFDQLVDLLKLPRSTSYNPLFQMMVTTNSDYGLPTTSAAGPGGLSFEAVLPACPAAKFDLEVNLNVSAQELCISWLYDRALFSASLIERCQQQLAAVLARFADCAAPAQTALWQLTTLNPAELALLPSLQGPAASYQQSSSSIADQFARMATRWPEQTALRCRQQTLTYRQLDEAANLLAHRLRQQLSLTVDSKIALCLPRSVELIVAMLAVLKAGAVYVPLNPDEPTSRLQFMLADISACAVLTAPALAELPALKGWPLWLLQSDLTVAGQSPWQATDGHSAPQLPLHMDGNQLAYVMYTSGSTGQPKGVMVPHRGVLRLVTQPAFMALDHQTVFLQSANTAFDAATLEIWGPLLNGGQCVLYPESVLTLQQLNQVIRAYQINAIWLTAGLFSEWSHTCDASLPLRYILAGGDVLDPQAVARVQQKLPTAQLVNGYGPTENTTFTCCWPVPAGIAADRAIPIGQPLTGDWVLLLDEDLQPVPAGGVGELCVSGPGLATGYLNLAESVADRFIDNPWYHPALPAYYQRLYKTGDLARFNAQAQLEYCGRTDHQLKIRGFRVELAEIEQKLSLLASVQRALVLAPRTAQGQRQLTAYLQLIPEAEALYQQEPQTWFTQFKVQCAALLPEYMVPAALAVVERWPLTNNGKIDRAALPLPQSLQFAGHYVAPQTAAEQLLVSSCAELLGVPGDTLSISANFFALGGHSLLLIQLIERLNRGGYQVPAQQLFNAATLQQMADLMQLAQPAQPETPANLIPAGATQITPEMLTLIRLSQAEIDQICRQVPGGAANIEDIYPLAPLQQGVLAMHAITEGRDPYVTTMAFECQSLALLEQLHRQLSFLLQRHDVLRTCILWRGRAEAIQLVLREVPLQVRWLPMPATDDVRQSFLQYVAQGAHRIELEAAPLLQLEALSTGRNGACYALLKVHHLLIDHVSLDIVMEELSVLEQGGAADLPSVIPYRHFIARTLQQQQLDVTGYFRDLLGDFTAPSLPFGLANITSDGSQTQELVMTLPAALSAGIRQQMKQLQLSPAVMFHLAFAMVLGACAGQKDVVFGTVLSGRVHGGPGTSRMLGMLINTLPVRIQLNNADSRTLLLQLQRQLQALLSYEQVSLSQASRCSGVDVSSPLFSAVLNYRHSHVATATADAEVALLGVKERTNYPLVLSVDDLASDFRLNLQVAPQIAAAPLASHVCAALAALLTALQSDEPRVVAALSVLSDAERTQQLLSWNDTARAFDSERCIHHWFEAQVALTPTAVAVECEGQSLSYAQLNARANQLAHYLKTVHGVGVDVLVGLCMERSLEMVIGLWAILKAGGAYVPLDPAYPAQRLAYLREDASVQVVLSQLSVMAQLGLSDAVVVSQQAWGFADWPVHNVADDAAHAGQLAYVIYTSGSTGQPKGVLNHHRALANRVEWMHNAYGRAAGDVVLQKTPYSFDVSVWEFVWPLVTGSRLVLARPEGHKEPAYLAEVIQAQGVSQLHFVPSMLGLMLEHGGLRDCKSVRQVFCSGEALQVGHVAAFKAQMPWAELHNLYGPTEAAIDVSYWDCRNDCATSVPIGKPIQNISLYILDEHQQLLPVGAAGELYIGGIGLARGYLNRPELTAERFVANPYYVPGSPNSSERLYRTGDLARYRSDGNIEYLGRLDFQVKLRGFRIELGEIEAALGQLAGIDSALVVAHGTGERQQLVGYYKANSAGHAGQLALKAQLQQKLPEHMVPAVLIEVQEWPLNANGKVDRKALPPVTVQASGGYQAPAGETEQLLAGIWSEVLGIPLAHISATASFFELGGHSLLLMKLVQHIDQIFRTRGISISKVVEYPVLSAMARVIDSHNDQQWQVLTVLRQVPAEACFAEVFIAPGAGMTSGGYVDLAAAMPHIRFLCLEPVGGHPLEPQIEHWDQLIELYAEAVISRLQGQQQPVYLLGHSSGGAVAFALATRLESLGRQVQLLLCECLVATDDQPQFQLSAAEKQQLMLDYARELQPSSDDAALLRWLDLSLTQRLFQSYFRQVDWSRMYRPQQQLQGQVYLVLTPERPAQYWQDVRQALLPHLRLPPVVINTEGAHVSMIRHPHVSTLAARLQAVVFGAPPTASTQQQHNALRQCSLTAAAD